MPRLFLCLYVALCCKARRITAARIGAECTGAALSYSDLI